METKPTILVIDDDGDVRLLVEEFLLKSGYQVVLAEDGQQALKMAAEKLPDLVITDLLLPKEHGIDVMQAIKDRFILPIIAMSGIYKKEEVGRMIEGVHIEGFFEKPLDLKQLLDCIRSILDE
jgi:DNA-binding response OmpR family regulator